MNKPFQNRVRAFLSKAEQIAHEYYHAPYRSALKQSLRDEDDLFLLWVYSELIGIPNPLVYHTLELQPLLLERFHNWHRRLGIERSPLAQIRCC